LARRGVKEAIDLTWKWHKIKSTRCAKQGADGVRIRDARQLDHDSVGPLRLYERLRDAGTVDATLNDVANGGEIGSGGADAINGLHLILNAKPTTKVETELGLNRARATRCAARRETEVWE
jgi:hypothetical protein